MELYSLTTGLIGQREEGALMLTIDVKHPDIKYFLNVKKDPNWLQAKLLNNVAGQAYLMKKELDTIKSKLWKIHKLDLLIFL